MKTTLKKSTNQFKSKTEKITTFQIQGVGANSPPPPATPQMTSMVEYFI